MNVSNTSQCYTPTDEFSKLLTIGSREILVLGTCHVGTSQGSRVTEAYRLFRPDAVAIELCRSRAEKIMGTKRPFINTLLAYGVDMDTACGLKTENHFIDLPIETTHASIVQAFSRITKERYISIGMKIAFVLGAVVARVRDLIGLSNLNHSNIRDSFGVNSTLDEVLTILLTNREEYMADNILDIKHDRILVVCGAVHVCALVDLLIKP